MMRVAVTDGMAKEAVKKLEHAGCDVIQEFIEHDDLVNGALGEFDAVIVRSATKISEDNDASKFASAESNRSSWGRCGQHRC